MDEERWQESLNARNTLAANQAIYAAWSAAWTAEAPLLMPMDASSASDKKRKVIEGESSPRGLKRMRFG